MRRPRTIRNGWYASRYVLGCHRLTFPLLRFAPAPYVRKTVDADTDACVDGFPRSANTLAVHAFLRLNPGTRLAHHVHLPQQILRAVEMKVPCAVLVRNPLDALTSLSIFAEQELSERLAVWTYVHFHRTMLELRDRVALCAFEEVIADPAVVPRRLNERYGTSFHADPMEPEATRHLIAEIERTHRFERNKPGSFTVPITEKERRKPRVREHIARQPAMAEAETVYRELAAGIRRGSQHQGVTISRS